MMTMTKRNTWLALALAVIAAVSVSGFTPQLQTRSTASRSSSTAVYGIFDMMKKGMESGYAGGDDSPYAKIKIQDEKKAAFNKKKSDERRKRGYTDISDVKERSFSKLKYGNKGDPEDVDKPNKEEKKFFGLF
jgi:hypothetical protein